MPYTEFNPIPDLSRYIENFWTFYNNKNIVIKSRIIPDGCSDIILKFNTSLSSIPEIIVTGQMTKHILIDIAPNQFFFGIRFRPGFLRYLIKTPMHELADNVIPLKYLDKKFNALLLHEVLKEIDQIKLFNKIQSFILNKIESINISTSPVEYIINKIISEHGIITIGNLSNCTGYFNKTNTKNF